MGSNFINYKNYHSIVLFAIADADYRFIWAEAGIPGRFSDGGVYSNSDFKKNYLDKLNLPSPYFFIGDDAFPLSERLLKPYK